jgi:hypothetical protein
MHSPRVIAFILAVASNSVVGADNLHLLGFVASSCNDADHCFELLVEPEFQALAGEHIHVHFNSDTRIFDPENYELTLAQQKIVPGSHLRLLAHADDSHEGAYRASYIWIGD